MRKIQGMTNLVSVALAFTLVITLLMGNISSSYQETKIINSEKIKPTTATDNNAFSDLSRNMTINPPSTGH